jgi:hypothetical protein
MQSALSEDDWRPGFAKRAPNFDAVCEQARAWRWSPGESIARIAGAVLKGTPTLTIQQRMTLLLYVEHLNQDRLEKDVACVWPSTALIADYLGCSESTARANRRGLEAAGYMVRDYNRANRPAGVEAYDLAPLVARLDEMEAADTALREAAQARRAQYLEPVVFAQRYTAQAPISRRLEQSQKNASSSVQDKDAPTPRSSSFARPATPPATSENNESSDQHNTSGKSSAICSPKRASGLGSAQSAPSAAAEMVRQELRAAVQVCPRLAVLVEDHILADPASAGPADVARIAAAAETWLPEIERNNALSVGWGWARHGPRVIAMLAIALEDPAVQNPCKYFGWMVTRTAQGAPDLRLNLARIMRVKGEIPPPEVASPVALMAAPGTDDPTWQAIATALRAIIREGAYGSWFGRVGFHGIEHGLLTLSTPSGIAADRIKRDYVTAILQAAEVAEVFVERVLVTLRKDHR